MFSNASCDGSLRPQLGQRRADRLGRFVAGNVVAAEAAVPAERAAGDVLELPLRAIVVVLVLADQHSLVDFDRRRELVGNALLGELLGQRFAGTTRVSHTVVRSFERLLFVGRKLAAGRHGLRLPIGRHAQQERHDVGRRVGHLAGRVAGRVVLRDRIEEHVRHHRARVVTVRRLEPAIEPALALRRVELGRDARQVGSLVRM